MEQKQSQRVRLTKKLLKDALGEMLKSRSIYKISIHDLCEKAGINRSTFYKHYGSQFDLLREIEDDLIEDALEFLKEHPGDYETSICMICRYFEQNIDIVRILLDESIDSEFPERLFTFPMVESEIRKTFAADYSDEQIAYASCFMVHGYLNTIKMWLMKEKRESAEEIAAFLVRMSKPESISAKSQMSKTDSISAKNQMLKADSISAKSQMKDAKKSTVGAAGLKAAPAGPSSINEKSPDSRKTKPAPAGAAVKK